MANMCHSPFGAKLDRLKELTRRDAEEQAKKCKRVEDRKVITEQIEARQRAKLVKLEAREQARRQTSLLPICTT